PAAAPTVAKTEPKAAAPTAAPAAGAATATAPAAAKPAAATPAPKVKRGGTLVTAIPNIPPTMDPLYDNGGRFLRELALYEAPLRYQLVDEQTGKQELKPWLAESWQTPDPKTIVLKFRKGVKFHDGSDLTAEVAKWSLDRMGSAPKSLSKAFAANFDKLEVVDPLTLKITYKNPSALNLLNLTNGTDGTGCVGPSIVSKAQMDKVGEEGFRTQPSGTGPMKLSEFRDGDVIAVTKAAGHWQQGVDGQPLPYLDGIRMRKISDSSVTVMEVKTGNVHLADEMILKTDYASIRADPQLNLLLLPWAGSRWYYGFNQHKEPFGTSLKLRQATNYAVDRVSMAKVLGMEAGAPLYYVTWAPGMVGYDESLPRYEFNLDKAIQLVKEAGFPNGVDIEYSHTVPTQYRKAAEVVQGMWLKAGIRATLNPMEETAARQKYKLGQFDVNAGAVTYSPDPAFFNRKYLCDGSANWSNYCNPELDKCLLEGERTLDDKQRGEIYKRCQKIIYEDSLLNGLFLEGPAIVTRKEVKGLKLQSLSPDLDEVWLDK
ncbi:MAG: ABC transporter substrate-binding protein, partial [Chloroflexi bacterium]|nr:ABC transporter substrate-binding protein [Chloroflexota bacterium]